MSEEFRLLSGPTLSLGWISTASSSQIDDEIATVERYIRRLKTRRNRLSSPLLSLPPEILGLVMDKVSEEEPYSYGAKVPHPMKNCSLVCSTLPPFTRPRLFSLVELCDVADCVHALLFARSDPNLYGMARGLVISHELSTNRPISPALVRAVIGHDIPYSSSVMELNVDWTDLGDTADLFRPLTRVRSVRLDGIVSVSPMLSGEAHDLVLRIFRQVSHVTIRGAHGTRFESTAAFYKFLHLFPSATTSMDISCIRIEDDTDCYTVSPFISPKTLRIAGKWNSPSTAAICGALIPNAVRELHCYYDTIIHDARIREEAYSHSLIQLIGGSLRAFVIPCVLPFCAHQSVAAVISRYAPALESLSLTLDHADEFAEKTVVLLQAISLPCLEMVQFSMTSYGQGNDHFPINISSIRVLCDFLLDPASTYRSLTVLRYKFDLGRSGWVLSLPCCEKLRRSLLAAGSYAIRMGFKGDTSTDVGSHREAGGTYGQDEDAHHNIDDWELEGSDHEKSVDERSHSTYDNRDYVEWEEYDLAPLHSGMRGMLATLSVVMRMVVRVGPTSGIDRVERRVGILSFRLRGRV